MKDFLMIFLLMVLGSGGAFLGKGIIEVRAKGDDFQFVHFIQENRNRLALLVFGLTILAPFLYLDPASLSSIFEMLPIEMKLGSPTALGFALAGLIFVLPRNNKPMPSVVPPVVPDDKDA